MKVDWKIILAFAVMLAAFGWVGEMDYQDQIAAECEQKGGDWNGKFCVKECK